MASDVALSLDTAASAIVSFNDFGPDVTAAAAQTDLGATSNHVQAASAGLRPVAALPASGPVALQITEDTPWISAPIDTGLAPPLQQQYEIVQPPERGQARIELPEFSSGNSLVVGPEQVMRVGGVAYRDVNPNGVLDYHSSEGWVGTPVFIDAVEPGWQVGWTVAALDLAATAPVYRGTTAIAVDAPDKFTGLAFYRSGGQGLPPTGLRTLRFAVRSDEPMLLSVSLSGDDGRPLVPPRFLESSGPVWQVIEFDLGGFGDLTAYKSLFFGAESAGRFQLDHIAFVGEADRAFPLNSTTQPDWGVNLFVHEDFAGDAAFADVTRTMRRWGPLDQPWLNATWTQPFTDDGVPREPAAAILFLTGYEPGIYQLRYRGTGSIGLRVFDSQAGEAFIVPGSMRNEGDVRVADVQITATGIGMALQIRATDAVDPIRDLQLLAPGYRGADAPTFRREFIDRLGPFSTLRMLNYTNTNWSEAEHWSERRQPNDVIQTTFEAGREGGVAWELLIELANSSGKDAWINLPHLADDDYIRQLAQLWRDRYAADQKLIVEFSNEIWNPAFGQFHDLNNADYYGVVGPRLVRIRQIFDEVWQDQADRVEIVLAGQSFNTDTLAQSLRYFDDQGIPAQSIVSALSVAMYAFLDTVEPVDSIDQIMTGMLDLSAERGAARSFQALAQRYGLPMYAYEAGQHLTRNQVSDADLLIAAQNDPRMADVIRGLHDIWQEIGGGLFVYYTFTGNSVSTSEWGMIEDLSTPGSVKWDAALDLLLPTGDADLDGRVTFADFRIVQANYQLVDLFWEQGDFNGDRRVDGTDLALLWQELDVSDLTSLQLAELREFASERGITLPQETLSMEVSSREVSEQGGVGSWLSLTVRRTGPTDAPLEIQLSNSDATELVLPSSAQIPAGSTSLVLTAWSVNDGILDGDQIVRLQATSLGYRGSDVAVAVRDAGLGIAEQVLAGATVFLDANGNGQWDADERTQVTNAAGEYLFSDVGPGQYRVLVSADGDGARAMVRPVGVLTFETGADFQSLTANQAKSVQFTYRTRDAAGSAGELGVMQLTVIGQNDPPVAQPLSHSAYEDGVPVVAQALADDIDSDDGPGQLTFQLLQLPAEGSASLDAQGRFVFDPGDDFQDLDIGQQRAVTLSYRVTDSHGATADSFIKVVVRGTDDDWRQIDPPKVVQVRVNSTAWTPEFQSGVGEMAGGLVGYEVPIGTDLQSAPLPWVNVDQIILQFDQDVNVRAEDLTIYGVNVAQYPVLDFYYDAVSFVGVWTIDGSGGGSAASGSFSGIAADKILVGLSDSVASRRGIRLDGEWLTDLDEFSNGPGQLPSGNGTTGGDFYFRLDFLPGDTAQAAAHRGYVNVVDTAAVRGQQGTAVGALNYRPQLDVNGDGIINATDIDLVRKRQFSLLPVALPSPNGPILIQATGAESPPTPSPASPGPGSENTEIPPPLNPLSSEPTATEPASDELSPDANDGRDAASDVSSAIDGTNSANAPGSAQAEPPQTVTFSNLPPASAYVQEPTTTALIDQLFSSPAFSATSTTDTDLLDQSESTSVETSVVTAQSVDTLLKQLPQGARQCFI